MLAQRSLSLLAFVSLLAPLAAQPAPKKVDDKVLVTKVYNLKPLLGDRGKAGGLADAEAIVKLIFEAIPQLRELKVGADGPQIVERDGSKLEVRTTAKRHDEVKELLEALERLQDLAIDVKADVIELDPKAVEKLVAALPKIEKGKPQSPILFGGTSGDEEEVLHEANKLLKAGKVIQTSTARYANGIETLLSARHAIGTYYPAQDEAKKPQGQLQYVKDGFALTGFPLVTADRRFVRFKLTEQSTILHGFKTREIRGFGDVLMETRVSPDVSDVGATGSAVVPDGGTVLFRLAYAPKDKVWMVVLKPTIFIQAEEDELKKQEKK